jgi:hypothetical protein
MQKNAIATIGAALLLACVSSSPRASTRDLKLENGRLVQLVGVGTVALPDGEVGLLIDYVTGHPLHSKAVDQEIPFVWWEFLPELRRQGFTQGLVRVMSTPPGAGRTEGRMWRGCLTDSGETLWLNLDGTLTESSRSAGKQCSRSTAVLQGEPTLRIEPGR